MATNILGTSILNVPSHTHTISTWPYPPTPKPIYPPSEFDKKIISLQGLAGNTLTPENEKVFHVFRYNTVENAISVFGNYNPMYAGKPKWLAMRLLEGAAGRSRFNSRLLTAGLSYKTPMLIGVRKSGLYTSYVGLGLLDHWAEKFPRFKAFVDAYVTKKMRGKIASDCVDLSFHQLPADWAAAELLNKTYKVKWEAKQYRKMKKKQERDEYERVRQQQMLLQAQQNPLASQQYHQQLLGQQAQIMGPMYGK